MRCRLVRAARAGAHKQRSNAASRSPPYISTQYSDDHVTSCTHPPGCQSLWPPHSWPHQSPTAAPQTAPATRGQTQPRPRPAAGRWAGGPRGGSARGVPRGARLGPCARPLAPARPIAATAARPHHPPQHNPCSAQPITAPRVDHHCGPPHTTRPSSNFIQSNGQCPAPAPRPPPLAGSLPAAPRAWRHSWTPGPPPRPPAARAPPRARPRPRAGLGVEKQGLKRASAGAQRSGRAVGSAVRPAQARPQQSRPAAERPPAGCRPPPFCATLQTAAPPARPRRSPPPAASQSYPSRCTCRQSHTQACRCALGVGCAAVLQAVRLERLQHCRVAIVLRCSTPPMLAAARSRKGRQKRPLRLHSSRSTHVLLAIRVVR